MGSIPAAHGSRRRSRSAKSTLDSTPCCDASPGVCRDPGQGAEGGPPRSGASLLHPKATEGSRESRLHRSPARPSAHGPLCAIPFSPASRFPSFFLHHEKTPEEKLHQKLHQNQPQPSGSRSRHTHAPTLRSARQQRHALPSEDTTLTFLLFLKAFFKDYWAAPGSEAPSPTAPPQHRAPTPQCIHATQAIPRACWQRELVPLRNFSTSLFSPSSLCGCSGNFRERRRASMIKSRWMLGSICSLPPRRHAALIWHLRKRF